jgi:hypothetical protein
MNDTLKRIEKIEREIGVGDEVATRVFVVKFVAPGTERTGARGREGH